MSTELHDYAFNIGSVTYVCIELRIQGHPHKQAIHPHNITAVSIKFVHVHYNVTT